MDKKTISQNLEQRIDPKDLMAVERATTALLGVSVSLIVLGFVIEKFELFLYIIAIELKDKSHPPLPQLAYMDFYNYLGIAIVATGILTALYTYRYYTNWVSHLEKKEMQTDKKIYFFLSLFVALVGSVLLVSMIVF